ncbi:MAG: rhomboid family intramembrane serine protease [Saprospiraceae bacterium]|nr:rhomboid family intramembrane serine protease [Saprospiraceae bacterium]
MSITLVLIIINIIISWSALNNQELFLKLQHSPYLEYNNREFYRFISSGFVHGSIAHLAINMFVFYQFGNYVEGAFVQIFGEGMGRINFLLLYLLAIIFGDLSTYFKHKDSPYFASVGASGAVSAILFVFVLFEPWQTLLIFFIIPCPAIAAAILYLIYSSWASKNQNDQIDHDAHFYGAVFGVAFTLLLRPSLFSLFTSRLAEGFPF